MSNKHKSSVIEAAGFLAAFNHQLFVAAEQAGISEERLYELLNGNADFVAKLVKVFVASAEPVAQGLAEMIDACRFRYADSGITEANFPIGGPIADVGRMLTLAQKDLGDQRMTTAEIEAVIDRKGYRPATLTELLAYAKAKWNGKGLVVALGSSYVGPGGDCCVPWLGEYEGGRELSLSRVNPRSRWRVVYLFLVVHKEPLSD